MLELPTTLHVDFVTVRHWLESLDVVGLVCLRLSEPCLLEGATFSSSKLNFCLVRGGKVSGCFVTEPTESGVLVSSIEGEARVWELEQMMKRFDLNAHALLENAVAAEVDSRMETDAREVGAWTFSGSVGALVGIPKGPSPSLLLRLGVRRWLSPYLIVGLAPGYERRLFSDPGSPRDSVGLTAKVEFSWFDEDAKKMAQRLNLPLLSAFLGLTSSLGLFPEQVIASQRVFVGLQLLFLFIEAGVVVGAAPGASPSPSFYLAVGFGT